MVLALVIAILIYFFNYRQPTSNSSSQRSSVQVIDNSSNSGDYRTIISNGRYRTSAARGITVTTETNFNVQSFENSLINLSRSFFSPRRYIFQEGQYLSSSTLTDWLNRSSSDNPQGLNPPDNGRRDNGRNPYYLQSIEEDDFVNQSGSGNFDLEGMTIGMAMNRADHYSAQQGGPTLTQNIPRNQMVEQGQSMAGKVLQRLRANKRIPNNVPILIVMYENSPEDSLAGGSPYAYYLSRSGSNIGSWTDPQIRNIVLPKSNGDHSSLGSQDNTTFSNFQNQIENFFPSISSATAQAHYDHDNLAGLNVTVNTNFYSVSEIRAFSSYISQIMPRYFGGTIPVRISVYASNQLLSVINRDSGANDFHITYLYSY
ncbi:CamS family sex pheromone protein [Oenococcus alcoholitolerans]|uniref:CamS family sex pheromone protein n=1 Tax=Oenococcus alcoholitolerans TaxID=931074 RepID=UPI003F708103